MMKNRAVDLRTEADIIAARGAGREMARHLGFGLADQTRLATAISELTRNVIQYAGQGVCFVSDESDGQMIRVKIVVEDNGPGIPDIEQALEPGFSTSGGLGAGLPGARRLVHEFHIESEPGGTKVAVAMVRPRL